MSFVSITRLRLRSWRYLPMFMLYAFRSGREAAKAEGNLATQVLNDRNRTFWTATIWTTDGAMKKFMLAGAHREAMRKLLHWCDEAAVAHWTQESNDLPTWPEAHARLESEGRRSKVNHPSAAHMAHKFPEPRVGRANIRLK
ncbi:MAG TPA: DUF3291 domain-containing protein [Candidatus Acidoferrales bacterium]|nr:DUF3291 domain-containing protein [Candidatus Acidoferrales bacterium]